MATLPYPDTPPPSTRQERAPRRPIKTWIEEVLERRDAEYLRFPGTYQASQVYRLRTQWLELDFEMRPAADPGRHPSNPVVELWVRRKPDRVELERATINAALQAAADEPEPDWWAEVFGDEDAIEP